MQSMAGIGNALLSIMRGKPNPFSMDIDGLKKALFKSDKDSSAANTASRASGRSTGTSARSKVSVEEEHLPAPAATPGFLSLPDTAKMPKNAQESQSSTPKSPKSLSTHEPSPKHSARSETEGAKQKRLKSQRAVKTICKVLQRCKPFQVKIFYLFIDLFIYFIFFFLFFTFFLFSFFSFFFFLGRMLILFVNYFSG